MLPNASMQTPSRLVQLKINVRTRYSMVRLTDRPTGMTKVCSESFVRYGSHLTIRPASSSWLPVQRTCKFCEPEFFDEASIVHSLS